MKMQPSISRNMSVTPQKIMHRSTSSLHLSPLTSCINLPLAQNPNFSKTYYFKPKEAENRQNYPIDASQIPPNTLNEVRKNIQTPDKMTENNTNAYKTSSSSNSNEAKAEINFNAIMLRERGRASNAFDINLMKDMQSRFKKLLEENEKLKCSLIQKNKFEEENTMNQHIAYKQISDLESQIQDLRQDNNNLQNQLQGFRRQNESNINLLQETEEKMVNYMKSIETGKSTTKCLTFENINLKKTNEELLMKINSYQNKTKQDSQQMQRQEEAINKLTKEQEMLVNSWNAKYNELQQSFVLEKNLHQQSEKSLKIKIQSLEEELKAMNQKFNETNENMMKLHAELSNEREKTQILEYKLKENQTDLSNFQEIESKVMLIKQDNDKLVELVSLLKKDKDLFEKELFHKQNELKAMNSDLDEARKLNDDLKNEIEFYKENYDDSEKNKQALENDLMTQKEEIQELIHLNETWENKINLLISETEKLSAVLREKDSYIENMQEEFKSVDSKFNDLKTAFEKCENDLKISLSSNSEYAKKLNELEARLIETQKGRDQLESDKKAIIHFYEDNRIRIDKELEGYKNKYANILRELEDCRVRFEEYTKLKFEDNSSEVKFQAEKSSFQTEIFQLKNKITEYEIAYNALLKKTEDLHIRNNENHNERENMQIESSEKIESLEKSNTELTVYVERLKNALFEKEEMILKLDNTKKKFEGQVKEFKEIIQYNKEEIEQLYRISNQKTNDHEGLQQEMERINQENNILSKENKEMKKFTNKFKEEENNYKRTIEILTNTSKEYKMQIDHFSAELNAKNKEVIEKIEDLDKMKENYGKCLAKIQVLETKLLNKLQNK